MAGQPASGSNVVLTFDVTAMDIREAPPGGFFGAPSTIIPATSGFVAEVSFALAGFLANYVAGHADPYEVILRAESLGEQFEGTLGTYVGNLAAGQLSYGSGQPGPVPSINVAAGALEPGVYKLVAVVRFTGAVPPPMVGFVEGPILQIA